MKKIKLGFAPTRRSIFSAPDAVKFRGLTAKRLEELGIDFVDITDINRKVFCMMIRMWRRSRPSSKPREWTA